MTRTLAMTVGRGARAARRVLAPGSRDALARATRGGRDATSEFVRRELGGVRAFEDRDALLTACVRERPRRGHVLEFGVYKGRSLNRIAELVGPAVVVTGFDSFEGLPDDWAGRLPRGTYRLARPPPVASNARLVVGPFERTVPEFVREHAGPASFVHIDSDLYASARTVLAHVELGPGSVVLFDEFYNYPGWEEGEARAWRERVEAASLSFDYFGHCPRSEQVAVRIRAP